MFAGAKMRQEKPEICADTSIIDTIDDVSTFSPFPANKTQERLILETAGVSRVPNLLEGSRVVHEWRLQEL